MERRALLVEDDELFVEILTRIVKPFGIEAVHCPSAARALEQLQARDYDVIFLDLRLSGSDGGMVVDYLRRAKPHALRRVIVLTGHPGMAPALTPDVPMIDKGNLATLPSRLRALLEG